jgi:hypothetical protein
VQELCQVPAVVQDNMGLGLQDGFQVGFILLRGRAAPGSHEDIARSRQRGRDVILGAQGIATGDGDLGASGAQYVSQISRLGFQVNAEGEPQIFEGLLALKLRSNSIEQAHAPLDPLDLLLSGGS